MHEFHPVSSLVRYDKPAAGVTDKRQDSAPDCDAVLTVSNVLTAGVALLDSFQLLQHVIVGQ